MSSPRFLSGTVNYNLTGWLEKNKDPLNDSVIDLMKNSSNATLPIVFKDLAGHAVDEDSGPGKKKKGGGKTVSSFYKEQLFHLMTTLHSTEPHFIRYFLFLSSSDVPHRCIVPNTHKAAGIIDAILVMHQLTCNGVLEGIRICRKGFPNRMVYKDFQSRYGGPLDRPSQFLTLTAGILNPGAVKAASTPKAGVKVTEEKQQQSMAMVSTVSSYSHLHSSVHPYFFQGDHEHGWPGEGEVPAGPHQGLLQGRGAGYDGGVQGGAGEHAERERCGIHSISTRSSAKYQPTDRGQDT